MRKFCIIQFKMFQLVLLVSTIAGTFGASLAQFSNGRIVGGEDATIEEFPWQISLRLVWIGHVCGGSIINANYILTAAHCLRVWEFYVMYKVHAGSTFRSSGGVLVDLSQIKIHPKYNQMLFDYDYAVLKLRSPLTFGSKIQPIHLAERDTVVPPGTMALVSGWGSTEEDITLPDILQKISMPIVDQAVCRDIFASSGNITDRMICAGILEGGRGVWKGDSGGALVVDNVQIGIASCVAGFVPPNLPAVFARVSTVREWIDSVSQ